MSWEGGSRRIEQKHIGISILGIGFDSSKLVDSWQSTVPFRAVTCKKKDALGLIASVLALDQAPGVVEASLLSNILAFSDILLFQNL